MGAVREQLFAVAPAGSRDRLKEFQLRFSRAVAAPDAFLRRQETCVCHELCELD
jgi:hypothetical protein